MSWRIKILSIGISASIVVLAGVLFVPGTLLAVAAYGPATFFESEVYSLPSPDQRYRISVSRRIHFPVLFGFDSPPATIYVRLRAVEAPWACGPVEFDIHEASELQKPRLQWYSDKVTVEDIGPTKNLSFPSGTPPNDLRLQKPSVPRLQVVKRLVIIGNLLIGSICRV